MKEVNSIKFGIILFALLLSSMVLIPMVSADNNNERLTFIVNLSQATPCVQMSPLQDIQAAADRIGSQPVIDDDLYRISAPEYSTDLIKSFGPVSIDKNGRPAKNGIASHFKTVADRDAWYRKVDSVYNATKHTVDEKFGYPRGPILGHARDTFGAITVELYDKLDVKEETINQIYEIIRDEAKKQGIDDIPVAFIRSPMPRITSSYTDIWRPVIGGVQGASSEGKAFTLGMTATRRGVNGIITVNHAGGLGATIYQPDDGSHSIGTVTAVSNGANSDSEFIAYSNVGGQIFEPTTTRFVSGTKDPSEGLQVTKSGFTTGVTSGKIIKQTPLYNEYYGKSLDNQWYVDLQSDAGDSGAPVYYTDANGYAKIVGILWGQGRYAVFSPHSSVVTDLS